MTWIPSIYPIFVSIYTSTMDPSWAIDTANISDDLTEIRRWMNPEVRSGHPKHRRLGDAWSAGQSRLQGKAGALKTGCPCIRDRLCTALDRGWPEIWCSLP
jgi:hypothetical protein